MMYRAPGRVPDFYNLELVLSKKPTPRPVLFDFIIGAEKEKLLTGDEYRTATEFDRIVTTIKAYDSGGYDFAPILVRGLEFVQCTQMQDGLSTKSLNSAAVIYDRESFDRYIWPEVCNCDFSIIGRAAEHLSKGMEFVPFSFDGVLENTISILGYENLCYLLHDDPGLVGDVFENVGKRMLQYFDCCTQHEAVGAVLLNDDWGFNTQTMIDPQFLRKYVFPWYREIVKLVHSRGKFAIQHSCGYYGDIIGDVIDDIGFDGRHSYEDAIVSVEKAYDDFNGRIAVLGGMDVGFLTTSSEEEVYSRCRAMLEKTRHRGGYALGSGNSVPDYISNANYLAMLKAANEGY